MTRLDANCTILFATRLLLLWAATAPDERRGKVVIVGSPGFGYFPVHVAKYGDPIAARTGYPTMVLSHTSGFPN